MVQSNWFLNATDLAMKRHEQRKRTSAATYASHRVCWLPQPVLTHHFVVLWLYIVTWCRIVFTCVLRFSIHLHFGHQITQRFEAERCAPCGIDLLNFCWGWHTMGPLWMFGQQAGKWCQRTEDFSETRWAVYRCRIEMRQHDSLLFFSTHFVCWKLLLKLP